MDLIQQFIDTYKMKWTFYDAAGRLAAEKLQLALQNAGIRAIVTSRAKNPARLRTKVQRRNSKREEPYQTHSRKSTTTLPICPVCASPCISPATAAR